MSTKVTDLTALAGSGAAAGDLLYVVDAGTGSKKMTFEEFLNAVPVVASTALTGANVAGGDKILIDDAGTAKTITVTNLITAIATLGLTLADIPEYADQAAAQAGLSGTGKLFRFATTGALGITIA